MIQTIRIQTEPKRTAIYVHVPSPERGLSVQGQPLPNLPGSVRAVFASKREGAGGPDSHRHDPRGGDATGSSRGCSRSGLRWPRMPGCRYRIVELFGLCPTQRPRGTKCATLRQRPGFADLSRLVCAAIIVLGLATWAVAPAAAKVETWRQEGPTAFAKCHREGVVISDNGRVRLGHALSPLGSLAAERVWDLAQSRDGVVVRRHGRRRQGLSPRAQGRCALDPRLRFDRHPGLVAGRPCPMGRYYAGTGPNGQVVNLSDPKHPASRPSPKVQYIWDLAADSQGNLYAATGPNGQLWKRSADGKWALRLRQQGDAPALPGDRSRRLGLRRR